MRPGEQAGIGAQDVKAEEPGGPEVPGHVAQPRSSIVEMEQVLGDPERGGHEGIAAVEPRAADVTLRQPDPPPDAGRLETQLVLQGTQHGRRGIDAVNVDPGAGNRQEVSSASAAHLQDGPAHLFGKGRVEGDVLRTAGGRVIGVVETGHRTVRIVIRRLGRIHGSHQDIDASEKSYTILAREDGMSADDKDEDLYRVVVNDEEQYSIWPMDKENALGWRDAGKTGTKTECLAHIKVVWTDMRPKSLRDRMEQDKKKP